MENGSTALDAPIGEAVEPGQHSNPIIGVRGLQKRFHRTGGEEVVAVNGVSLEVLPGEMVVLLGPSGCGKTTLLRCIGGLEKPDDGEITINGSLVASPMTRPVAPERRNIGMMFQSYALWPHMSVKKIVAYPLASRKVPKAEIARRVTNMLRIVGIEALADQYPGQLSGGQQQRVALARSLVAEPAVMLFDEPLSNVDAKVRGQLRDEIASMQRRLGFAGIYVTHDQDEAMQLADRLAVMQTGAIVQISSPREVYTRPATNYVARFVGAANTWTGRLSHQPGTGDPNAGLEVDQLGQVLVTAGNVAPGVCPGQDVCVLVRPEAVSISIGEAVSESNTWQGEISSQMFTGAYTQYSIRLSSGAEATCWTFDSNNLEIPIGTAVSVAIDPRRVAVLPPDRQ